MKPFRTILLCVNSLCLVVLLFTVSISIYAFNEGFYRFQFRRNNSYEVLYSRFGVDEYNLHIAARSVIDYMARRIDAETFAETTVMIDDEPVLFFTALEACHMDDVWVYFNIGLTARTVSAIGFPLTLLLLVLTKAENGYKRIVRRLLKYWRGFALATLALFAALGILVTVDFDRTFHVFHELLFVDNWTFNPRTSMMINMLPGAFFQNIAIFMIGTFVFCLAVISVLPSIFKKKYGR